ncbi:hypothetical protein TcasGA2_TC009863 [Tribolium castaneum]|uniref:Uncharacterized protein n=1 Tax=Tribolium castaneum TaxID=7070 RepID=D6WQ33_TRICA|nr:hypothetical protein TcasGA2_TC009863 [Tribolium castaneum]
MAKGLYGPADSYSDEQTSFINHTPNLRQTHKKAISQTCLNLIARISSGIFGGSHPIEVLKLASTIFRTGSYEDVRFPTSPYQFSVQLLKYTGRENDKGLEENVLFYPLRQTCRHKTKRTPSQYNKTFSILKPRTLSSFLQHKYPFSSSPP